MLAKKRTVSSEKIERRGAPSKRYCPLGESKEQREKHVKIKEVDKKAVEIIDGLMRITVSNNGPSPKPMQKYKS